MNHCDMVPAYSLMCRRTLGADARSSSSLFTCCHSVAQQSVRARRFTTHRLRCHVCDAAERCRACVDRRCAATVHDTWTERAFAIRTHHTTSNVNTNTCTRAAVRAHSCRPLVCLSCEPISRRHSHRTVRMDGCYVKCVARRRAAMRLGGATCNTIGTAYDPSPHRAPFESPHSDGRGCSMWCGGRTRRCLYAVRISQCRCRHRRRKRIGDAGLHTTYAPHNISNRKLANGVENLHDTYAGRVLSDRHVDIVPPLIEPGIGVSTHARTRTLTQLHESTGREEP